MVLSLPAIIAAGVLFGKGLANRVVRQVRRAEGQDRGTSTQRINPPIPALPGSQYGKLDGALAAGSSATVSRYYWNGSAWADTTSNDTVYAPPLLTSGSIASGKWVEYYWNIAASRFIVCGREC